MDMKMKGKRTMGGEDGRQGSKGESVGMGGQERLGGRENNRKKGQHIHRFLFFIQYGHKTNKIFEIRNSSTNRNIFTFS